jgi:hypothetical protein
MRTNLNPWSSKVHDYCISTNSSVSTAEAAAMFGRPTSGTASNLLNSAASAGYFRREEFQEESSEGVVTRVRYRAVDKPQTSARRPSSWFDGLQRVRSVFELGQNFE